MKNRKILTLFFALASVCLLPIHVDAQRTKANSQPIDLNPTTSTKQIVRVQTQLEGKGTVLPDEQQTLKLRVDGRFRYDERVIARAKLLKSIRSYDIAKAQLRIGDTTRINQLDSRPGFVIAQTSGLDQPVRLASIGKPLTQNQFELINTPANTLVIGEVFKKTSVKKGQSWDPNKVALARFLNIDSIQSSDVEIRLDSIKDRHAILYIGGDVEGTIDGSSTQITVSGSAAFNIPQGIVSRCDITLSQQRDIGLLAPGLDAVFKISTRIQPINNSQTLSNQGLANLKKQAGSITDGLMLQPKGSLTSLIHSRDWRVISDHTNRTVLRYNDRGRMLGQCDIIPLPNRISDRPQTIEQFKQVVLNSLDDESARIISSNQATTPTGIDWLRVQAEGQSSGINLVWTYYTLTNDDGQRVQLVFTTEPENARQFMRTNQEIIDSINFSEAAKQTQNASFAKPKKK